MTGYGRGGSGNFKVEVRSFNHRGLDIQSKIPSYLYSYEPEIKKTVKKFFHRGHIELFITPEEEEAIRLKINKPLAKELYNALKSLKEELSIPGDVGINIIASQKNIFLQEEQEVKLTDLHIALESALKELEEMRIREGENLFRDIIERMHFIKEHINNLEDKRTEFVTNAKRMLLEKLKDLLGDTSIEESRLIQEVAILLGRSDITEELVRIKSHLKYMEDMLKTDAPIGKKMDFLTQELHRELNTISSKAASPEISSLVIELKDEVEKIREQAQNLE